MDFVDFFSKPNIPMECPRIGIIHFTNYAKGQSRASMSAVMQYTIQDKKTQ